MKKIHKEHFDVRKERVTFDLPFGSIIVYVGSQFENHISFWYEFEIEETVIETRTFRVFGTGHSIPENYQYLGTAMDRPFVWHLYEEFDYETGYYIRETADQTVA